MSEPTKSAPLVVIGYGAMASAIVEGAFDAGVLLPRDTFIAHPSAHPDSPAATRGCRVFSRAEEALDASPQDARILLAVKPQMLPEVAAGLTGQASERAVISILAGVTVAHLTRSLGAARVVRVMPNTPARIGRGISAIAPGPGALPHDAAFARSLFGAVGETLDLDESLMDAFTGVAGSGPAYLFYLAEAMTRGAVGVGLPEDQADRIVRAVLSGSTALLDADHALSARQLREAVTSRKGTTAAATDALDRAGVMTAVVDAIRAARDRGRELSEG